LIGIVFIIGDQSVLIHPITPPYRVPVLINLNFPLVVVVFILIVY
jgi:hypothetical protein